MRKVILTADLHFHQWQAFASVTSDGKNTRLTNILNCVNSISDYAADNNIHNVFWLGDIYHKRGVLDVFTTNAVSSALHHAVDLGLTMHLLVGNHDQADLLGASHALSPWDGFNKHINIYHKPRYTIVGNHLIYMIPFNNDHSKINETIQNANQDVEYIFGHFSVKGAKVISSDFVVKKGVDPKVIDSKIKGTYLGHYHTRQTMRMGNGGTVTYVGNPIQHSFQDVGQDKGFHVLDLDTGGLQFVKLDYPQFVNIDVHTNEEVVALCKEYNGSDFINLKTHNFLLSNEAFKLITGSNIPFQQIFIQDHTSSKIDKINIVNLIHKYIIDNNIKDKSAFYKELRNVLDEE